MSNPKVRERAEGTLRTCKEMGALIGCQFRRFDRLDVRCMCGVCT